MPTTRYQVTLGERVLRVELRSDSGTLYARVDDGPEQPVELSPVRGALWSLSLGERRTELLARAAGQQATVVIDGLEYATEVQDELRARLAQVGGERAATHARRELKAPMPGLVARVLCAVGDRVEAGQPLVVLQAMKMENELALPGGGTVASVSVEAGQTVEQGEALVVLE